MDSPMELMRTLRKPTATDRSIAGFFLEHPGHVLHSNLSELAQMMQVSNTAIIRFCQKLGYQGFSEFKYDMSRYVHSGEVYVASTNSEQTTQERASGIIQKYSQFLSRMSAELDSQALKTLAASMVEAKRIISEGYNRTGIPATQLAHRLTRLGVACQPIVTDTVMMADYANIFATGDLVVVFSITGSHMYYENMKMLQQRGCKTVLITMNGQSALRKYASQLIVLPRISRTEDISFLDDQAIFLVYVELIIAEVAYLIRNAQAQEGSSDTQ